MISKQGTSYSNKSSSCVSVVTPGNSSNAGNCTANETNVNGKCSCKTNYYKIKDGCSQCPPNTGYNAKSSTCVPCVFNQVSFNSICVCKEKFYLINSTCTTCPAGTSYNKQLLSCVSSCGVNYITVNG